MPGGSPRRAPLLLAGALVFGLLAFASAPVVVSALETHGVGLAARTQSSGPHAASAGRLRITATLTDVGYVGVTIAGPSGAKVQLGEALPSGTKPIQIVRLGSQGARVPKALRWSCDERKRNLVATTLPPAAPQDAKVSVMTPGCSQRLVATISKQALVGRTASISLHDRWGIGDLPLRICITPPGGTPACKQSSLRSDQSRQVVRFTAPRPGGWRVDVSTRFGDHTRATVWVSHPGGRIRLLATGDSEMLVLDSYLATDLASHGVDAYEVSGPHGRPIYCCGSAWSAGYAKLVAKMMRSYLRGNAGRVYWFLLPTPRPRDFQYLFDGVNSGIRQAAKQFPGRVALIDANAFFTPHNHYRNQMTDHGYGFTIHEPDGIHLTTISDIFAADLVVKQLLADRVIR